MGASVGLGTPIPGRAPAERTPLGVPHPRTVAAVTAALIAIAVIGLSPGHAVVATLAIVPLVYVTAVDIDRRLIPNVVVLPATLVVLLAQAVLFGDALLSCVLAGLLAALLLFAPRLLNTDSMGMGDVKLALLLGAMLGRTVTVALFLGMLAALLPGIVLIARHGSKGGRWASRSRRSSRSARSRRSSGGTRCSTSGCTSSLEGFAQEGDYRAPKTCSLRVFDATESGLTPGLPDADTSFEGSGP